MASEWIETTLGAVSNFQSGGTPSKDKEEYWGGITPWVSAKDMKQFFLEDTQDHLTEAGVACGTRLAESGTVFLLTRGMTLLNDIPISVSSRPMAFNQDVKALTPKNGILSQYLPYLLLGHKPALLDLVDLAGHGTGRLNTPELKGFSTLLPPVEEQRAIAYILGTLDDKIELNRKMNETLEAMARALFQSWFVDFDPVRANAEGRPAGLPDSIAALFPNSFQNSELGPIPSGWTAEPIGNLTEVIGGSTPSTKEQGFWAPEGHAWATPKDLSNLQSPVILTTERKISNRGLQQIGSGLLPAGTILMSSWAPIGYLAIAEIPVAINQGFIAMKPKDSVSNLFLLYWAEVAQEVIKSRANGSTFLEISKSNFREIDVVRPDASVLKQFDAYVRPWYKRIVLNELESSELVSARDSLLPKLISGELRVPNREGVS